MNWEQITKQTREACEEVAEFIRNEAAHFSREDIEHKGFNDLVSYVDKTAEEQLVQKLGKILPEAGFIAEEGTAEAKEAPYHWVIDPLDGTTNFVHGLPVYAISVALVKKEMPVVGVVVDLGQHKTFSAWKDGGAYMDALPIHVSKAPELAQSLLATGFPYYDFGRMDDYLKILKGFMESTHGLRRMGSAAIDLVYVACGRFEGFFEYNLNAWDVAAGALIVQEAGGKVTDFSAGDKYLFGREIVASNSKIHEAMLSQINTFWEKPITKG